MIDVRIRDGLRPEPSTGEGGATEGDIRGSFSDIIDVVGVKDLSGGHCLVTENSPQGLSVLIADGIVYIPNADYDELDSNEPKFYEAILKDIPALEIAENTSGSTRIDLACVKVDKTITPDEHARNISTAIIIQGTPGAGAPTLPDNHAKLGEIEVANNASTIVNADITDSRVQADINGAYVKKSNGLTFTEIPAPSTPAANKVILYAKDKSGVSTLYYLDDSGIEVELGQVTPPDGWISISTVPTYASANTINVPSGAASIYQKGDKYKFTQHGVVKHFYIIGVADTLLTVTAGSDNVVEDTTIYPITLPYYSHQENPIGFPSSFEYTPTQVGFSTTMSTLKAYFHINGRMVYVTFARGTNDGVSNATNLTLSLPVTAENKSNHIYNGFCTAVDNNIVLTSPSLWLVLEGATVCTFEKATGSANWTNSGSKAILNASVYYNI